MIHPSNPYSMPSSPAMDLMGNGLNHWIKIRKKKLNHILKWSNLSNKNNRDQAPVVVLMTRDLCECVVLTLKKV